MMNLDNLRLARNILLRSAAVGIGFAAMLVLGTLAGWNAWMSLATQWFHTSEAIVGPMVLNFFIEVRFYLVFVLLTPGLALHWTLKREMARKNLSA